MRLQSQEIGLSEDCPHYKIRGCDALENLYFVSSMIHAATTQQQSVNNNGSRVPILSRHYDGDPLSSAVKSS